MKVMKLALLGTAALAAASLGANANDLSDLKAQIEALNSRIATLEAAPSVPAGYNLMTFSKAPRILAPGEKLESGDLALASTIGILPTADVPASTSIQWGGRVAAAFVYGSVDEDNDFFDTNETHITANVEINLTATTDTAVGEVGFFTRFKASSLGDLNDGGSISRYYGWWKMTPELSMKAGYKDSIGGIGHGSDLCNCYFNSFVGIAGSSGDSAQFELRYASGPIEAAVTIGDYDDTAGLGPSDSDYVVNAEVKWAGDSVSAEVAGFFGEKDDNTEVWQVGAGATFTMDMFTLSANGGVGQFTDNHDYWMASLFARASLSDSVSAEIGVGIQDEDEFGVDVTKTGVAGGLYWAPVDKLLIGAEASWVNLDDGGYETDTVTAALVTVFKF